MKEHTAITLTKVVFPENCNPTSVSSISSFQNKLLNQSNILLIMVIIFPSFYGSTTIQLLIIRIKLFKYIQIRPK